MPYSELLTPVLSGLILTILSGVLALLGWLHPLVRWRRAIIRDITILGGLPSGAERDKWEASVMAQATRIREYREKKPALAIFYNVITLIIALLIGVVCTFFAIFVIDATIDRFLSLSLPEGVNVLFFALLFAIIITPFWYMSRREERKSDTSE